MLSAQKNPSRSQLYLTAQPPTSLPPSPQGSRGSAQMRPARPTNWELPQGKAACLLLSTAPPCTAEAVP